MVQGERLYSLFLLRVRMSIAMGFVIPGGVLFLLGTGKNISRRLARGGEAWKTFFAMDTVEHAAGAKEFIQVYTSNHTIKGNGIR